MTGGGPERTAPRLQTPDLYTMNEKQTPLGNIEIPESVKREADRIENDPDAMLRLIDYIFFLRDEEGPPS